MAESTRPLVDVALFQFQATVLVALSILEDAVAAARDESVVVPVFINDPFQYRVLPRAYRAWVVVAGVADARARPFCEMVRPVAVLVARVLVPVTVSLDTVVVARVEVPVIIVLPETLRA